MIIKKRNLFRLTRFILLKLPYLLRFINKFRTAQKKVLIIKTDGIGDYVLFRNFLETVKKSEKFQDHEIDLLGNIASRDIALWYDKPFVNNFSFIAKPDELYESPLQLLKLSWFFFKANYAVVLQPSYTRTFIGDGIAAITGAVNIIGFASDNEGILPKYKNKTDKFYSKQLMLPAIYNFEFDRTRYFFEQVLDDVIDMAGPHFPAKTTGRQGVTIFLGAGNIKRGWQTENFLQLMELIIAQTGQPVHLTGGPEVTEMANYLESMFPKDTVINLAGKTTLPQLIDHIARTQLVICNETSAVHIAVASQTKAVCILGGGHFGRFAPYPDHVYNRCVFVFEKMPCYYCNWLCIFDTPPADPFPCVANVTLAAVWQATQQMLNS